MNEAVLFDYPYSLFLMERLEFVLLCQDELEAKILRVVEYEMLKAMDARSTAATASCQERRIPPREPSTLWVQLSHAQFLSRLYKYDTGKVGARQPLSMSKGTLRKAINSLLAKQLLFVRARPGDEFGAPEYTLNCPLIQEKLNALPADPFHVFCPGKAASPEPARHLRNLHLPPAHSEQGDLQNTHLPPPTSAHPQMQNLHIFKYTKQESLKENKESCNSDVAHSRTFTSDFFSLLTFITALTPEQKRQLTRALLPHDFSYSHGGGGVTLAL